jgi:arsenite/tail-anchored protein-transporting ATPase
MENMTALFQPYTFPFTRYLFFTGKGGVGKTSTACATAISLADRGKKVLIVSTDPASNLQDVFEMKLSNHPNPIPEVQNLFAANLDPEQAAANYREKMVGPYRGKLPDSVIQTMEEQLSGACTVEIAAFDEFTNLLANPSFMQDFDHIIFDTAPTGHTLRLLQLPTAWAGFLNESTHGASCLGPLSGLSEKKEIYGKTVSSLSNPNETTLILVSRPDASSLQEAARASGELFDIGITNQMLLLNGVMQQFIPEDEVSSAFYHRQQEALKAMPDSLKKIVTYELPLVSFPLTGIQHLREFFQDHEKAADFVKEPFNLDVPGLKTLVDEVARKNHGVVFTMGKGGVGKTTMASAIAVGLAEKGHQVHLTTTDPAAHLSFVFRDEKAKERLTISRIDPKAEVEDYRLEVLNQVASTLDEEGLAYLNEDLNSPCTEEIAVFRAFAKVVEKSENQFVVIDTAPTGHTLLLLDAAESYHKEITRSTGEVPESVKKLLPRLRNPEETTVAIVTLAEATPVFEASRLQDDLRRAGISPQWWVINQSFATTQTNDPLLRGRAQAEHKWIQTVRDKLADQTVIVPWQMKEFLGYEKINSLI